MYRNSRTSTSSVFKDIAISDIYHICLFCAWQNATNARRRMMLDAFALLKCPKNACIMYKSLYVKLPKLSIDIVWLQVFLAGMLRSLIFKISYKVSRIQRDDIFKGMLRLLTPIIVIIIVMIIMIMIMKLIIIIITITNKLHSKCH